MRTDVSAPADDTAAGAASKQADAAINKANFFIPGSSMHVIQDRRPCNGPACAKPRKRTVVRVAFNVRAAVWFLRPAGSARLTDSMPKGSVRAAIDCASSRGEAYV